MTAGVRLVGALLPRSWPDRDAALVAAWHVDRLHGAAALNLVLASWIRLRETGERPREQWLADLVLVLQEFLAGGLEPRLTPRGSIG